jgi:thiamine-phosphate pyrophosphorylase
MPMQSAHGPHQGRRCAQSPCHGRATGAGEAAITLWKNALAAKPLFHLVTPPVEDPGAFQPLLESALRDLRPASLHLKIAATDPHTVKRHVQALSAVIQESGAALLIDPPADLREVVRWGADGVHAADPAMIRMALQALKPDRIVGVGGLRSRDAAMEAGEDGADYVMFGEPRADGSLPPVEQVVDRCRWWAEVFNVPCIGYAQDAGAVKLLSGTGAEFIALGPWAFGDAKVRAAAIESLG